MDNQSFANDSRRSFSLFGKIKPQKSSKKATKEKMGHFECKKCDKTFASGFTQSRHMKRFHANRPPQPSKTDSGQETQSSQSSEDSDTGTDHYWRAVLKHILRKWKNEGRQMPQNATDLMDLKSAISDALYRQTVQMLNNYEEMSSSPMFKAITRTAHSLHEQSRIEVNEAFHTAFENRTNLIANFLYKNADVLRNYDESSNGEDSKDAPSDDNSDNTSE